MNNRKRAIKKIVLLVITLVGFTTFVDSGSFIHDPENQEMVTFIMKATVIGCILTLLPDLLQNKSKKGNTAESQHNNNIHF